MLVHPFLALRPPTDLAARIASPPYDVIDSDEARVMAEGNPQSFLHINKPEIDLPTDMSLYDDRVYAKGAENFQRFQREGWLRREKSPGLYLYRQEAGGHAQTGVVGVCHTSEYDSGLIKKHEKTLQKKEDDRTRHVATLKANAGPVFLMVRAPDALKQAMEDIKKQAPEVDFTSADGVRHSVWPVADSAAFVKMFAAIPCAYIADGHHRAASAARCSREFAAANPANTGEENYNWFLSVLFPADALQILPYNRLVSGLNGHSAGEFFDAIRAAGFSVVDVDTGNPRGRGDIRMRFMGNWFRLQRPADPAADPVSALDVSVLQNFLLAPILGIQDPRTDPRIRFKGGFDCVAQLEKEVETRKADVAFSLYPTSTEEVMSVADAGMIMPPKSTWFEPKLRSGLFVHTLD